MMNNEFRTKPKEITVTTGKEKCKDLGITIDFSRYDCVSSFMMYDYI